MQLLNNVYIPHCYGKTLILQPQKKKERQRKRNDYSAVKQTHKRNAFFRLALGKKKKESKKSHQ